MAVEIRDHILGFGKGDWRLLALNEEHVVDIVTISDLARIATYVVGVGKEPGGYTQRRHEVREGKEWKVITDLAYNPVQRLGVQEHRVGFFKGKRVRVR